MRSDGVVDIRFASFWCMGRSQYALDSSQDCRLVVLNKYKACVR